MSSDEVHEPRHWKVKKQDGSRLEPANLDVLRHWVASRQIEPDDLVINEELADWIRASEVLELFDLFEKREPHPPPAAEPEPIPIEIREAEVEVPDCAYHPGRKATEICVGCGKFICEECRERLEGKMYCRRCRAEKQAGVEPGAPVGPGAPARIISGVSPASTMSRLAIASLVFAVVALGASSMMVVSRFILTTAPAVAFIAFIAAMLGGLAFNRIRLSGGVLRGGPLALAGLISGCLMLVASLTVAFVFTGRLQRASEGDTGRLGGLGQQIPGRRQGVARRQPLPDLTKKGREEREANAKQLLEQVEKYLNEGQLDQAVSISKTILGLYPDTETAKLIEERLPALEQVLARRRAEEEEIKQQNEQLSQQRFEHALTMYSEGNRATALDLLKSIVESYPETNAAEQARVEITKIEKAIADQELKRLDEEASRLAGQANRRMESEQYAEAVEMYREIMSRYPQTPTATTIRPKLKEAELLASDPSEREFRKIQKEFQANTYEESIALLQDFLAKYPDSNRADEAKGLLDENQASKRTADSLYNFGRTYFEEQKYNVAVGRYGKLINEYPRSRWIPQAKKEYEETLEKLRE